MADCCEQINIRLSALEAEVRAIKKVDEESWISKALSRVPDLPKIKQLDTGVSKLGTDLGIVNELATGASQWVNAIGKPTLPVVEGDIDRLLAQIKNTANKSDVDRLIQQVNEASRQSGEALQKAGEATGKANNAMDKAREAISEIVKRVGEFNEKFAGLMQVITPLLNILGLVGSLTAFGHLIATIKLIFPRLDRIDSAIDAVQHDLTIVNGLALRGIVTAKDAKARAELAINTAFDAASQVITAKLKAEEAISAARGANSKSAIAISDAKTAIRKADNAQGTADEAKTLAGEARDTASSVRGIAEDAKVLAQKVDGKLGGLSSEVSGLHGVTVGLKQEDTRLNARIDNIKTIDVEARKIAERAEAKANEANGLGQENKSAIAGIKGLLDLAKGDIANLKGEDSKLRNKDAELSARIDAIKPGNNIDEVARSRATDAVNRAVDASNKAEGASVAANGALGLGRDNAGKIDGLRTVLDLAKTDIASLKGEIPKLRAKDGDLQTQIDLLKNGKGASASEVAAKLKADPGFIALTKGDKGLDGRTPKKGIDYFDGINGKTPIKGIDYKDGLNGYTPRKGIDYFNGYTPIKGKDYRDGIDGINGINGKNGYTPKKGIDYKDGKDGKDVNPADVAELKAGQKRTQDLVTNLIGNLPNMLAIGFLGVRPALQPDFNSINNNITNITNNLPRTACSAFPAAQQTQSVINQNTNLQIGRTNQRIGIVNGTLSAINTFLSSKVMGAVNTIVATTNTIKTKLTELSNWLHLDRVLGLINIWLTFHNAIMLSNNLAQSLFSTVDNILNATGLGMKDAQGNPLNLSQVLGVEIDYFFKGIFGFETFENMKSTYKKWSVVYQAAANLMFTLQSIGYSILAALEVVGSWVAQIGNALKFFRVVGEKAFSWMNPEVNFQNKFFTGIEQASNIVSNIDSVSQSVIGVTQAVGQLETQKTELDNALKQAQGSSQGTKPPEAAAEKVKQEAAKAVSQSPPIANADQVNPED